MTSPDQETRDAAERYAFIKPGTFNSYKVFHGVPKRYTDFLAGAAYMQERILKLLRSEHAQDEPWVISGNSWADWIEKQIGGEK